ncbi:MAG: nSTAND1 domain-containing NTPase [Solirubrobacteraceae bacterium]
MIEFRILGPFEVVDDERSLALGGPKQRALLAALLLHRGEVISADRLIDELWSRQPPATAVKTLRVYVSNLRKALGDGFLVTRGRGYLLTPKPDQVDVDRFERLTAEGRVALERGDARVARERLRAALALWRGSALADFTYEPFAGPEIARLEQARLSALEDRIDADLALGSDGTLIAELEGLVVANPLEERLRGQLMRALYRAGRQADALAVYRQTRELLREELGLEPSRMLHELERSILEQDPSLDARSQRGGSVAVCPYKGLAFFDRADADFFFGRERLITDLIARLVESTVVGILGPSGIGKSSLLRAGVLPALSSGALPGSAGWRQVLLRPGAHPCRQLRRALGSDRFGEVVEQLPPGQRIVAAVDQFEELFSVCQAANERESFLRELVAAAHDPERRAIVLVSLRADFYGHLASYPRFGNLLSASHVLVGPMDHDELTRTVEQPAARAALELEPGLADALVSDVVGEAGGLPLLSTTLLELWRARDGQTLRYSSYRRSGGVRGAVARLAEDAYTALGVAEREIARHIMLRLAGGDADAPVRRRVTLAELERFNGASPVIAALTNARLLTVSDGEVELSHEALLHEWPRYRAWLEEDQVGRRLHGHLSRSAREWDATGHDHGDLYRGARLTGALDWAGQHSDELSPIERRFLTASRRQADRNARTLRALLAGVALLALAALVAGAIALVEKDRAATEARLALARQLDAEAATEPRLDLAMLLAREAISLDRSSQTEGSLLATIQRSHAGFERRFTVGGTAPCCQPPAPLVPPLALSPDGTTFAVRLGPTTVGLFATHTLRRERSFSISPSGAVITALAWAPTASELAVGGRSGVVQLWHSRGTPRLAESLSGLQAAPGQAEAIQGVAFSPDGRLIAADDASETVPPRGALPPSAPATNRVSFLAIWRTGSGKLSSGLYPLDLGSGPAPYGPLAFSPNSRLVAVGAPDGSHAVIDAVTAQRLPRLYPIGSEYTSSLAFSPHGTLATGTVTGIVQMWDPISGRRLADPFPVTASPVASIAFDPSGQRLATASQDGTVKLFSASTLEQEGKTLTSEDGSAPSAIFGPHGNNLLVINNLGDGLILPTSPAAWAQRACAIAGRNLSRQEWNLFVPGQGYTRNCS